MLNFYFTFITCFSGFFLDLQDEHRLQEQGMLWEGYFGEGAGGSLHWWRVSG